MSRDYALPWTRGIGNESRKIWDANGRLVATMETSADSTFLVDSINKFAQFEESNIALRRTVRRLMWGYDPENLTMQSVYREAEQILKAGVGK